MKRYIKNLWLALTGRNPFRAELEELKREIGETALKVKSLQDVCQRLFGNWENSQNLLSDSEEIIRERDRQIVSLQRLVENLRQRIIQEDDE